MGFSDAFPDDAIMNSLGDDVVYAPQQGGAYPIKAIIEFDQFIDEYHSEKRDEIEFLKSTIGWPIEQGDSIIYNGKTYKLDTRVSQDDAYERWGLRDG